MSPPMPPKQPGAGAGAGDPLPVVGSDRPQTPVDDGGGEFLVLIVSVLLPTLSTGQRLHTYMTYMPKPHTYLNQLSSYPSCLLYHAGSWLHRINHRQMKIPKVWKMQGLGPLKYPSFATSSNLVPT
jgi:hypothetical protein